MEDLSGICQALNLDRRESVKDLLAAKRRSRWIENLSRRQKAQEFSLMDRENCRKAINKKPRNLDGSGICRGSIERKKRPEKILDKTSYLSRS